jgi:peptidoglycan/LPS O-acetylase OafA/YrhL
MGLEENPSTTGRKKLPELESLRGAAAVVVLFHHFLLTFAPHLHGRDFPDDPIALVRTPLFALINGSAAVAVFFVLSGFVLTYRPMQRRDGIQLIVGAAKRWPRLVLLVTTVNILSGVFLAFGLYVHLDRSWLDPENYAGATELMRGISVLKYALHEGMFVTFVRGDASLNAALWTMHYELFGSFAAYATALAMLITKTFRRAMLIGGASLVLIAMFTGEGGIYFSMLVAGVLIARIYIERPAVLALNGSWGALAAFGAAMFAVVLCGYDGYSKPSGFYSFMAPYASPQTEQLVHGAAAVVILSLVLYWNPVRRVLVGRFARILGRLSFPIYLVHLPILQGIIFPIHAALAGSFGELLAQPVSFVFFMAMTGAAAWPLAYLDEWWIGKLQDTAAFSVTKVRHTWKRRLANEPALAAPAAEGPSRDPAPPEDDPAGFGDPLARVSAAVTGSLSSRRR